MNQPTIGNVEQLTFTQVGKSVQAKIDTGATTSSIHATEIKIDQSRHTVTFVSDVLSSGRMTLDLVGVQEVHSADAGGAARPVVELDIEIGGVSLKSMKFNLNDRSNMDSPVLVGQNVLQAGQFLIDTTQIDSKPQAPDRDAAVAEALATLAANNVTLAEAITYLQTLAIAKLK